MARGYFLAATLPLTWRKLRASKSLVAASSVFPLALVLLWARDSYETTCKIFTVLFPHLYLIACQDLIRSEVESGALENSLFIGGKYKIYVGAKPFAAASIVSVYVLILFAVLCASGGLLYGLDGGFPKRFLLGLVAGWYYCALGGLLSRYLRSGSNVVTILLGQAGFFLILILSEWGREAILGFLETSRFPSWPSVCIFGLFTAVFPNIVVLLGSPGFIVEILLSGTCLLYAHWRLSGRLELAGRESAGC